MPVDGKCARCGYKAPVLSFIDATEYGQFQTLYAQIPASIQKHFLRYLNLFRPVSGCQMQHSKVDRLTRDFITLVTKGYVSEKGLADRSCQPAQWCLGMEAMQEQVTKLKLPMKSHNYLRSIVWNLADSADNKGETKRRSEEANGTTRARRQTEPQEEEMSREARKFVDKYGEPELPPAVAEALARVKARMNHNGGDHG